MNAALRRTITFGAMVTAGVAAVWLLQEEKAPGRSLAHGTTEAKKDSVGLIHKESDTKVEVTVGELDFDVTREVDDGGVRQTRPVYRVHILDGQPAPDGSAFLVSDPTITFLDIDTGAVKGVLSALRGRFETDQAAGGKLRFDFSSNFNAERFSLSGDVHGEFPMQDGRTATLDAQSLQADGQVILAPGEVTWRREDIALTGKDMRWEEDSGRLTYARDAEIELLEVEGRAGATIRSPRGLTWNLPVDRSGGQGWGELHGPVTGEATDGSRIAAETLSVGADAGSLTLRGAALVEAPRAGRMWRATAPHMTVARDELGLLALGQADGGVRLQDVDDPGTWLEAESLTSRAGVVVAPGPVRWGRAGVTAAGRDLSWSEGTGRLELATDTVLVGEQASEALFVGARLESPGGLEWVLPAPGEQAGFGRLRGPVTGTLANGSEVRCDVLIWDELARRATLQGQAFVRHRSLTGSDELSADRLELTLAETGELSGALCTGSVRFVRTPTSGPASMLSASRLEVLGDLITAPGAVFIEHGRLRASGRDLRYDDDLGRLDLERDAVLAITDPTTDRELTLESALGVTWWLPADRSQGAEAGHGELAGPVKGRTTGGGTLRADRGIVRAGMSGLELLGDADIVWAGVGHVASEHLDIQSRPEGLRAESNEFVVWNRGTMKASGRRMVLDEAAGTLDFASDVDLVFRDESGATDMAISSAGPLSWTSPPGSTDPLSEGRGEFRDEVVGRDASGGAFSTDRLVVDGPAGLVELHGPSHVEHLALLATLDASEGIGLERDPEGTVRRLVATGNVVGRQRGTATELEVSGDELVVDRPQHLMTLTGSARIARHEEDRSVSLSTVPEGTIHATTDESHRLATVDIDGPVTITTDELRALSDTLTWDVAADHVVMEGACRFQGIGGWMDAPRVEIWPEAGRWHVPRSVIVVDDRR